MHPISPKVVVAVVIAAVGAPVPVGATVVIVTRYVHNVLNKTNYSDTL